MKFFADYNNLALLAVAAASGLLLAWPAIRRRLAGGAARVSAPMATQLINRRSAIVVDVREAADYVAGHVPQAKHAALDDLAAKAAGLTRNKSAPIVLVCQTGQRAGRAQIVLKRAGYREVYALEGGMAAWRKGGLPIVKH